MAVGYEAASCLLSRISLGSSICTVVDGMVVVATCGFTFPGIEEKGLWCVKVRGRTLLPRNMLIKSQKECLHVDVIISSKIISAGVVLRGLIK